MNFQEFLARKRALALVEHMNTLSESDAQELFDSLDEETIEFIEAVLSETSLGDKRQKRTFDPVHRKHYHQHGLVYPGDFKDPLSYSAAVAASMKNPFDPLEIIAHTQKFENLPPSRFDIIKKHRTNPRRADFQQRFAQGVENTLKKSSNPDATYNELQTMGQKIDQDSQGKIKLDPTERRSMIKTLVSFARPKSGLAQRNTNRDELAPRVVKGREETTKQRMQRLAAERAMKSGPHQ